jgi:type II secretory pathway component GspD/PulD (secretin)
MTPEQEKYILAAQEQTLNTVINIHAEVRATRELLILLANGVIKFPDGQTAQEYWKNNFDAAFSALSQQSQAEILKKLK